MERFQDSHHNNTATPTFPVTAQDTMTSPSSSVSTHIYVDDSLTVSGSESDGESQNGNQNAIHTLDFTLSYFNPSQSDVIAVRHSLQDFRVTLPPELALRILHFAGYHPRLESRRSRYISYHANDFWSPGPNASVAGLYLASAPIPEPSERLGARGIKVRWIVFQMKSADQGWADFGGHGTYHNSHTWFDASILRPTQRPATEGRLEDVVTERFRTPADARESLREHGWDFVENDESLVWRVHNNITAQADYSYYRVDWVAGTKTNLEDPEAMGNGEGFLDKLTPGRVVVLWAVAEVSC